MNKGIKDPSSIFPYKEDGLELPPPLIEFYKRIGSLSRGKYSNYDTNFHILSLKNLELLAVEYEDDFKYLSEDSYHFFKETSASDWIMIGGEAEYGQYYINCSIKTEYFGVVFTYIQNIPDVYSVWRNFNEFLKGIPYSVLLNPPFCYDDGGSDPFYGGSYTDRNEVLYYVQLLNEQAKNVFNIARIIFCSALVDDNEKMNFFDVLPVEIIHLILFHCGNSEKRILSNVKRRIITRIESSVLNLKIIRDIIDYAGRKETIGKSRRDFEKFIATKIEDPFVASCASYFSREVEDE